MIRWPPTTGVALEAAVVLLLLLPLLLPPAHETATSANARAAPRDLTLQLAAIFPPVLRIQGPSRLGTRCEADRHTCWRPEPYAMDMRIGGRGAGRARVELQIGDAVENGAQHEPHFGAGQVHSQAHV